jgi:hypothetical protein
MSLKNIVATLGFILICSGLSYIVISGSLKKPRKTVTLSSNNKVVNYIANTNYDTVISLALDKLGITGINVRILPLSKKAKLEFDGELKAHLRYKDNQFYLYTDFLYNSEAIDILSHEAIHVQQYLSKDFIYQDIIAKAYWKGEEVDLDKIPYEKRPWEVEAFKKQWYVSEKVYDDLY